MGRVQTLFNHSGLLESSRTRGGDGIPNGTSVKFVAVPGGHCFMLPAWMGCVGRGWWRQVVWCGVVWRGVEWWVVVVVVVVWWVAMVWW